MKHVKAGCLYPQHLIITLKITSVRYDPRSTPVLQRPVGDENNRSTWIPSGPLSLPRGSFPSLHLFKILNNLCGFILNSLRVSQIFCNQIYTEIKGPAPHDLLIQQGSPPEAPTLATFPVEKGRLFILK